ncbi:MAG: 50S ribosomal L9 C-terminal domain-containing protein [Dolichospermum sp.]
MTISEDSIKSLGTYNAKVRLFKEIAANITFEVVAE